MLEYWLARSCAGNHSSCEFMSITVMTCPEAFHSTHRYSQPLTFCSLLYDVPREGRIEGCGLFLFVIQSSKRVLPSVIAPVTSSHYLLLLHPPPAPFPASRLVSFSQRTHDLNNWIKMTSWLEQSKEALRHMRRINKVDTIQCHRKGCSRVRQTNSWITDRHWLRLVSSASVVTLPC